jgi:hypothetical protein
MHEGVREFWCWLRKTSKVRQKEAVGRIQLALQENRKHQPSVVSPQPVPSDRGIQVELSLWERGRRPIREEFLPVLENIMTDWLSRIRVSAPGLGKSSFALLIPQDEEAFKDAEARYITARGKLSLICDSVCPHCNYLVSTLGNFCMYCGGQLRPDVQRSPAETLSQDHRKKSITSIKKPQTPPKEEVTGVDVCGKGRLNVDKKSKGKKCAGRIP